MTQIYKNENLPILSPDDFITIISYKKRMIGHIEGENYILYSELIMILACTL